MTTLVTATTATTATTLIRGQQGRQAARVRMVHIGLGAFHRAHQAWYTEHGDPAWGIAAFTGRSPEAAHTLGAQDNLYTLITRGPQGDEFEVLSSIVASHDGADVATLCTYFAQPEVSVLTLTITEAGYRLTPEDGRLGLSSSDQEVREDIDALRTLTPAFLTFDDLVESLSQLRLVSAPARIVAGLMVRAAKNAGTFTVISCDNLPDNGIAARESILGLARQVDAELGQWIRANISFVSSSIDRITPRTTPADKQTVLAHTGVDDNSPVVTEPFSSWVLSGEFKGPRPAWDNAGAEFVENLEPFENRKLWLLNGAHSFMAYAGQLRGHATVAQALEDPLVAKGITELWDLAQTYLTEPELEISAYREALHARFANPRIEHFLAQIANDGSIKLGARIAPILHRELVHGRMPTGGLKPLAAWCDYLERQFANGMSITDPQSTQIAAVFKNPATSSTSIDQTQALVRLIDQQLATELELISQLHALRGSFDS